MLRMYRYDIRKTLVIAVISYNQSIILVYFDHLLNLAVNCNIVLSVEMCTHSMVPNFLVHYYTS